VFNPADPGDLVGEVFEAELDTVEHAIKSAVEDSAEWARSNREERAACLQRVAELYEQNAAELFALLAREAGKSWLDAVGEVREAVDFARYYATQLDSLNTNLSARGVIACISPWNFPLAIFSGQVFAALATGNCVIAKPAEQTSLIAAFAGDLMYQAGIPRTAFQLLPGRGSPECRCAYCRYLLHGFNGDRDAHQPQHGPTFTSNGTVDCRDWWFECHDCRLYRVARAGGSRCAGLRFSKCGATLLCIAYALSARGCSG
jgi:hypothetical protein